jgi:hypothetical protein
MPPVRPYGAVLLGSAVLMLTLGLAGCSQLHWPWHKPPPAAPQAVHYLEVGGTGAAAVLAQYWQRNTLVVDLTAASGTGSLTLRPPAEGWPVRVALRVTPGAIGELDVRGAERVVLPIVPGAVRPLDLEIAPAVYTAKTPEIAVAWGPAAAPAT